MNFYINILFVFLLYFPVLILFLQIYFKALQFNNRRNCQNYAKLFKYFFQKPTLSWFYECNIRLSSIIILDQSM